MVEINFDKNSNKSVAYDNNVVVGECEFVEEKDCWNIIHTQVSNLYQGQGIARAMVECVIENSKTYNKNVKADCSYAKKVIESK